jgi:hypothetical protein
MKEQQQAVEKMDARLAEQMVRKWQIAKARALGASHAVSHLPEVRSHVAMILGFLFLQPTSVNT